MQGGDAREAGRAQGHKRALGAGLAGQKAAAKPLGRWLRWPGSTRGGVHSTACNACLEGGVGPVSNEEKKKDDP